MVSGTITNPMYVTITPHHLATRSLCRAANALEDVTGDPTLWFFAVLDLNRALYAALVAALSAENFDEAYGPKLQIQWKQFWEDSRTDPNAQSPTSNRVPYLPELIEMAQTAQLLHLADEQRADIMRLNKWRDNVEHVKPDSWTMPTADLLVMAKNVAEAFEQLFDRFQRKLEEDEVERTKFVLDRLKVAAGRS
jgi:hypothetical protein